MKKNIYSESFHELSLLASCSRMIDTIESIRYLVNEIENYKDDAKISKIYNQPMDIFSFDGNYLSTLSILSFCSDSNFDDVSKMFSNINGFRSLEKIPASLETIANGYPYLSLFFRSSATKFTTTDLIDWSIQKQERTKFEKGYKILVSDIIPSSFSYIYDYIISLLKFQFEKGNFATLEEMKELANNFIYQYTSKQDNDEKKFQSKHVLGKRPAYYKKEEC